MALGDDACNSSPPFPALLAAPRTPLARALGGASCGGYVSFAAERPAPTSHIISSRSHMVLALRATGQYSALSARLNSSVETFPTTRESHGGLARHTDKFIAPLMLYCGSTTRPCLVTRGRTVPDLHPGLARRVVRVLERLGVPRNAKALVCAGSEGRRSLGRCQMRHADATPSARRAGCARARFSECAVSKSAGAAASISRRERIRARSALDGEGSCV
ncbi:hypothetical protein FB451DRAFT_1175253 [Mycena latifolia]|nr:hypothetical protein FB451DRAFT_1175253 [Mycena latifolia]